MLCSCFRAPETRYDSPPEAVIPHSPPPHPYARDQRQPAPQAHSPAMQMAYLTPLNQKKVHTDVYRRTSNDLAAAADAPQQFTNHNSNNSDQLQAAEQPTPIAAPKPLSSHQITISPAAERGVSLDGSEMAADVVRQDNVDTMSTKTLSPKKAVLANDLMAQAAAMYKSTEFSDVAAESGTVDGDWQKAKPSKAPSCSSNTTPLSKTGSAKKPQWGVRASPAATNSHTTPVRSTPPHAAKTPTTPGSACALPSPSVTRPTCASMSRAQAVSASKPQVNNTGLWKL